MRFALLVCLLACGGKEEKPAAPAQPAPATPAPSAPAPAAPAAPAEQVGPEGPADLKVPEIKEISTDHEVVEAGEKVFQQKGCGGCHQFGSKLVGPDLVGVLSRRPLPWIERQIQHPEEMTKRDPVAKDLFKTYMTQMTNQGVTDDELPKLLAYIKSKGG